MHWLSCLLTVRTIWICCWTPQTNRTHITHCAQGLRYVGTWFHLYLTRYKQMCTHKPETKTKATNRFKILFHSHFFFLVLLRLFGVFIFVVGVVTLARFLLLVLLFGYIFVVAFYFYFGCCCCNWFTRLQQCYRIEYEPRAGKENYFISFRYR